MQGAEDLIDVEHLSVADDKSSDGVLICASKFDWDIPEFQDAEG